MLQHRLSKDESLFETMYTGSKQQYIAALVFGYYLLFFDVKKHHCKIQIIEEKKYTGKKIITLQAPFLALQVAVAMDTRLSATVWFSLKHLAISYLTPLCSADMRQLSSLKIPRRCVTSTDGLQTIILVT